MVCLECRCDGLCGSGDGQGLYDSVEKSTISTYESFDGTYKPRPVGF